MVEEKAGRTTNKQNNAINPPVSIYSLGKHLNDGIPPPLRHGIPKLCHVTYNREKCSDC